MPERGHNQKTHPLKQKGSLRWMKEQMEEKATNLKRY